MSDTFTILGRRTEGAIDADALETFPCPETVEQVSFDTKELCAMCPVTGQPDLYTAQIRYLPNGKVVESKSLKLYLMRYRNVGIFGEDLAHEIAEDIFGAVHPKSITVTLEQQTRGGLVMTVIARKADR